VDALLPVNRRQRVQIGNVVSPWLQPNGGMPQGSFFGPYVFLILMNDLTANVPLIKFFDDVTAVECVTNDAYSQMQTVSDQIADWSYRNFMSVNSRQSKEMVFGSLRKDQRAPLVLRTGTIEAVQSLKLLGVYISDDLRWVSTLTQSVQRPVKDCALNLLRRSFVSEAKLLHYFHTVVRPALEYVCPVWQSSLTDEQRERIETIQRRALRIISGSNDYEVYCAVYYIEPLSVRFSNLTQSFFEHIRRPNDCLHYLLPPIRPNAVADKLGNCNNLPLIKCRTQRFQHSFLPYALANFQAK
jgi:hypothetical protein